MSLGITPALLKRFLELEPEEQAERIATMSITDLFDFDAGFEMWAHRNQLPPPGEGWRTWLMMAGRGFGKTRAGAEWVHKIAQSGVRRIALVAASIDEARSVMVEGVSGLLSVARNNRVKLKWEPSLNRLTWPGGSIATLFSGDNPDGMRGPEHHIAWDRALKQVIRRLRHLGNRIENCNLAPQRTLS
jgi:phage terminase large subunit-like protein